MQIFLLQDNADLYIFPEGFWDSNVLQEVIDIMFVKLRISIIFHVNKFVCKFNLEYIP